MKRFPDYLEQVEALVDDHRQLKDHALVLAIYYEVPSNPQDVYVLEVLLGLGVPSDTKDFIPTDDTDFFDAEYGSTDGFPMDNDSQLHLVLTSTVTFMYAKDWNWPQYQLIHEAVQKGRYRLIYKDSNFGAEQLLGWLTEKILV